MIDNHCDHTNCIHNRDGQCLDIESLKIPDKQTGCIFYSGMNQSDDDD